MSPECLERRCSPEDRPQPAAGITGLAPIGARPVSFVSAMCRHEGEAPRTWGRALESAQRTVVAIWTYTYLVAQKSA
jgi:hypothetical protein